ncbi:MAG: RimK/LysX family protein [Nanoarchaeota archaeon]
MEKPVLGLIEKVKINGLVLKAKIDTGADRNSICRSMITKLNLKPTGKKISVKSSHGTTKRSIYSGKLEIGGKIIQTDFTIIDRNSLKYSVLVGNNTLKHGFLIDPSK